MKNKILHDYRDDIICKERISDWNNLNILARTLEYELDSDCKDVEGYPFVCKCAFAEYCVDYKEKYATADIMNGWWTCFKNIFGINSRNDNEKKTELLNLAKENKTDEIIEKISFDREKQEVYESLTRFLKVVYTTGNITPAPINPGGRGLDCWEYKLNNYQSLYHDQRGDIEILHFEDYNCKEIPEYYKIVGDPDELIKYMNSRVELILKRSCRIYRCENLLDEIMEDL